MSDPSIFAKAGSIVLLFGLIIAGLSVTSPAAAQAFCSEPVTPYCVDTESQFDTMLQINRCEEDLENYEQQLLDYEQCISNQLETLREELNKAHEALSEAKENF